MELRADKQLVVAIGGLGFSSIITQTILLREFLAVFSGNELVIGVMLASWMVLTGLGAFLGKYISRLEVRKSLLAFLLLFAAVLPLTTVFLLDFLRNLIFPVGSMIGMVESLYGSFILLSPYCLVAGSLFTLLAQTISDQKNQNLISRVYAWESAGAILGGSLFNLLMVFFLTTFQSLIILTLVNLGIGLWVSRGYGKGYHRHAFLAATAMALLLGLTVSLDDVTRGFLFKGQSLVFYKDTPYGNLTVTQQGGQKSFYENSVLLFSTNDAATSEEAVHYAMVQHSSPRNVLLISGGLSGSIPEILKYGVERIDYVEMNPSIIDLGRMYGVGMGDGRVHVFSDDGRKFIRKTAGRYDVVLINVPDPSTAQINRYFTVEFLQQLRKKLRGGAVVSLSLLTSGDYLGKEAREVSSIVYQTLRSTFQNVLPVPGMRNYYLASDSPLDIRIARKISDRGIQTSYVNAYYVDDELLAQRSRALVESLRTPTLQNRDFTPVAYYRQVLYWLSYFRFSPWVPAGILGAVLALLLFRLNAVTFGLFAGGFAASSIELLLLVSFQIIYGYVYQATGVIITVFMAGLATGAFYAARKFVSVKMRGFAVVQMAIGAYATLLPLMLFVMKDRIAHDSLIHALFVLLTFLIAALVGVEFSLAASIRKGSVGSVASELYSIDLVGSAAGALIVSSFLLPLMGVVRVSWVIAALNFMGAGITWWNRQSRRSFVG